MSLANGTRLGSYVVVAPLGAGGMGEVYRARDTRLGREVAIKVLPGAVARDGERLARLEREARAVAALNHPNIVTIYSIEEVAGVRFLAMELLLGQTLDGCMRPGGLPTSQILSFAVPLADALVAAHQNAIVHRDLKPANVMITGDGRLKVLDFGLAKLVAGEDPPQKETIAATAAAPISGVGQVVGTVPYMAPEQIRGEPADARTDLFAFGIILYELSTGLRPFTGATAGDVHSSILRDAPVPAQTVRADLPRDLGRIIGRCLEKDPERRFQTAKDVRNELELVRRELEPGGAAPPGEGVPSIAVLPFANRSRDEEDEYFADGLADELLTVLTKIRGLRVAARTSAFHFKGKDATIAEVGSALNVASVLEGSVRKAGNRVRIAVQLVKVSDGYHLWSATYDRTLEDIFAVQDDIAQSVVKELRTTLMGEEADSKASGEARSEVAAAAKGRGESAEAHRLYLQGRYFLDRLTRKDLTKALRYLRRAVEVDTDHALAWAELARAFISRAGHGWAPLPEGFARAREAVERALALEPDLAEGHIEMARIQLLHDWSFQSAEASLRRALERAPGDARILGQVGTLRAYSGRLDESIELHRRAAEQDPLRAGAYHHLAAAYFAADRLEEAEGAYRKALDLVPQRSNTHAHLALVLLAAGRDDEAIAEAKREPDDAIRLWALAMVEHARGHRAASDVAVRKLIKTFAEGAAYQIAEVYAARGEIDQAFAWLERAYDQRDPGAMGVRADRNLRPLHGDPRWGAFLMRMGLRG